MTNPNKAFESKKEKPVFYCENCISFGTDLCEKDCDVCDAPKDEIELLCEAKW
jgi:hypothetical protein